jgi:DNA-binding transcriptional MerR regulator
MSEHYRVREFAELTGVTVKALHHYDRVGLLAPRRSRAGYRLYSTADRDRLEQINALKFVGLPLREVKILLNQRSPSLVDALMRQRRALDEQRKKLDRAVAAIDWELREAELAARTAGVRRAPDRFNGARVSLYRDIAAAIESGAADDVNGSCAQELIARWRAMVDDEMSNADDAARARVKEIFAGRKTWPPSLKQYVASLYQLEPAVWERVADFIEAGTRGWRLESLQPPASSCSR